ncbi:hypothetical protein BCR44DRAFT_1440055 [Catenaria anguillulae PL171]|uniref:Uncharacterized protein n=1 Tax=Catenaria anguillulae PL171 TaxID=765915 RepID=A0A1Y2HHH8_9FUNG|nr:hypothetical protein BCR44DRAFT_1440055 [Catenaria anguillulae PL171]
MRTRSLPQTMFRPTDRAFANFDCTRLTKFAHTSSGTQDAISCASPGQGTSLES